MPAQALSTEPQTRISNQESKAAAAPRVAAEDPTPIDQALVQKYLESLRQGVFLSE